MSRTKPPSVSRQPWKPSQHSDTYRPHRQPARPGAPRGRRRRHHRRRTAPWGEPRPGIRSPGARTSGCRCRRRLRARSVGPRSAARSGLPRASCSAAPRQLKTRQTLRPVAQPGATEARRPPRPSSSAAATTASSRRVIPRAEKRILVLGGGDKLVAGPAPTRRSPATGSTATRPPTTSST